MKYESTAKHTVTRYCRGRISGDRAAIQAARMGVQVALINDRGVLGCNSSCEIAVVVNGANDCAPINLNSREGGLAVKSFLEFKHRSLENNPYIWDTVRIPISFSVEKYSGIPEYLSRRGRG